MQINTGISIASLVVSVITLAIVLMLLAGKPGEPSQFGLEMSRGISEAQMLDACIAQVSRNMQLISMYHRMGSTSPNSTVSRNLRTLINANDGLISQYIMDNKCSDDEIGWEKPDPKDAD